MLRWQAAAHGAAATLVAGFLLSACFRSQAPLAAGDAGGARIDAGPTADARGPMDAGSAPVFEAARCPGDFLRVDTSLVYGLWPGPGMGTLVIEGPGGRLYEQPTTEEDRGFRLCVDRAESPLDFVFLQRGGNVILGVNGDLRGEVWGRPRFDPLNDPESFRGELRHQVPGSTFVVHVSTDHIRRLSDSPFQVRCEGLLSSCQMRYIEVGPQGELLGGSEMEVRHIVENVVLDTRGSQLESTRFEVELPDAGLLAGLPLTQVRPYDCSGNPGTAWPGELDLWRCTAAGVARFEVQDGVVRGQVQYVAGPSIEADTLVVRLGNAEQEGGLEAHVLEPCCTETELTEPLTFPRVDRLDGPAGHVVPTELAFDVEAPGYDHPFAAIDYPVGSVRVFGFRPNGRYEMQRLPQAQLETTDTMPNEPVKEFWVGAVTTEQDRAPWSAGMPRAMVRRRLVPE